jgi:hypothetical protein
MLTDFAAMSQVVKLARILKNNGILSPLLQGMTTLLKRKAVPLRNLYRPPCAGLTLLLLIVQGTEIPFCLNLYKCCAKLASVLVYCFIFELLPVFSCCF